MKNLAPTLFILFIITFLFSCSTNQFTVRKNFHPRVKIEANKNIPVIYTAQITVQNQSIKLNAEKLPINADLQQVEQKVDNKKKPTEQITKTIAVHKTPKKIKPNDKKLNKTKATNMDEAQVAGLVVSIIALCLAIASYLMIIWMANGGIFAGFIVGLVLAAAAIAMGFIGGALPFRGISWLARILGILAVFVLIVFLVLILLGII